MKEGRIEEVESDLVSCKKRIGGVERLRKKSRKDFKKGKSWTPNTAQDKRRSGKLNKVETLYDRDDDSISSMQIIGWGK